MSSFKKTLVLWCCMMAVLGIVAYVTIAYCLVRIGRLESTEMLRQAAQMEELDRPLAAIKAYEYASRFEANPTDSLLAMSRLERRVGNLDAAWSHASKALKTAPDGEELPAYLAMATSLYEQARWSEAQRAYQDATTLNNQCAEANHGLAMTAWQLGDFVAMADAFSRLRDLPLNDSSPAFVAAYRESERRLATTKGLIADQGESGQNLYEFAMNHFELGQWKQFTDAIQRAIAHPDAPADAFYWSAVVAEVDGYVDQAIERYTEAIDRLPDHFRAGQRLSVLKGTDR